MAIFGNKQCRNYEAMSELSGINISIKKLPIILICNRKITDTAAVNGSVVAGKMVRSAGIVLYI